MSRCEGLGFEGVCGLGGLGRSGGAWGLGSLRGLSS